MHETQEPPPRTAHNLPAQDISTEVLLEKYAKDDERSIDAVNARVARALAQAEAPADRARWEVAFADALRGAALAHDLLAVGSGRTPAEHADTPASTPR